MKSELAIAKELIKEIERCNSSGHNEDYRDELYLKSKIHKATCERFLEFLKDEDDVLSCVQEDEAESPSVRRVAYLCSKPFKQKIKDLKQTIKEYEGLRFKMPRANEEK